MFPLSLLSIRRIDQVKLSLFIFFSKMAHFQEWIQHLFLHLSSLLMHIWEASARKKVYYFVHKLLRLWCSFWLQREMMHPVFFVWNNTIPKAMVLRVKTLLGVRAAPKDTRKLCRYPAWANLSKSRVFCNDCVVLCPLFSQKVSSCVHFQPTMGCTSNVYVGRGVLRDGWSLTEMTVKAVDLERKHHSKARHRRVDIRSSLKRVHHSAVFLLSDWVAERVPLSPYCVVCVCFG